jgi:hypothetical protein
MDASLKREKKKTKGGRTFGQRDECPLSIHGLARPKHAPFFSLFSRPDLTGDRLH